MKVAAWSRLNRDEQEMHMPHKIGYNATRDPYPWDGAEVLASAAAWTCCGMNLPATYSLCPMCEKKRDQDLVDRAEPEI
jgi:hypothetical protein